MTFRTLAKQARNRLQATVDTKERTTSKALSVRDSYYISASKMRPVEDDPLYGKVKKMLENDVDTLSPIGRLIDHSVFDDLLPEEKDKYLLDLTKRYHRIKDKLTS